MAGLAGDFKAGAEFRRLEDLLDLQGPVLERGGDQLRREERDAPQAHHARHAQADADVRALAPADLGRQLLLRQEAEHEDSR